MTKVKQHLRLRIEYRMINKTRHMIRVGGTLDGGWYPYVTPFSEWEIDNTSFFPSLEGITVNTHVTFADDIPADIKDRIMTKWRHLHGIMERQAA
ncbi:MAG: hypothetical protein GY835_19830 [bacterium]|nr:hypothetical protein [bacterium]